VKAWLGSLLLHLLLLVLALFGVWAQLTYRVPGGKVLVMLPLAGVGLACVSLSLLVNHAVWGPWTDERWRRIFARVEIGSGALVLAFFLYGVFLTLNAELDGSRPVEYHSEIKSIRGGRVDVGFTLSYWWADIRSWRKPGAIEPMIVTNGERWNLWGGEPVVIQVREGFFHRPWISGVIRDEAEWSRRVLKQVPRAVWIWRGLAVHYYRRRQWPEMVAAAGEYFRLYPHDVDLAKQLSAPLYNTGHWKEAVALLEPLAGRVDNAEIYSRLGFALTRVGRKPEGLKWLEKSYALDPGDWWTPAALAYAHYADRDCQSAMPWIERSLALRATNPEVEDELNHCRAGTNR
jgi:hypothetical protein